MRSERDVEWRVLVAGSWGANRRTNEGAHHQWSFSTEFVRTCYNRAWFTINYTLKNPQHIIDYASAIVG